MRITQPISHGIQEVLYRWKKAKVPIRVENQNLFIRPQYFSALLRVLKEEYICHVNGERIKKDPVEDDKNCLRLVGHIGKDKEGSAVVNTGVENLPESPKVLRCSLDELMDSLVKRGAVAYLEGVGERIITTQAHTFVLNGVVRKVLYRQPQIRSSKNLEEFEPEVLQLCKDISSQVKEVREVYTELGLEREKSLFVDTKGNNILQRKELFTIIFSFKGENVRGRDVAVEDSLYFAHRDLYKREYLEKKVMKSIVDFQARREALRLDSGSYPVIFDGAAAGTFIHEALAAHLLSGKYVVEDDSLVFGTGRLGQRIIPEYLTIIDDPTDKTKIGSYDYDEEGVKSRRVVLVENGILKNYLLDKASATKLSLKLGIRLCSNGHSRSAWANDGIGSIAPEPRVANLFVKSSRLLSE
ncbi:TldD/PmbA family protein [Candidatus Woesearchaeota archaeon]|nr:TldD/PmbA family protein [Candidatus Woesearchaeota archaeon]